MMFLYEDRNIFVARCLAMGLTLEEANQLIAIAEDAFDNAKENDDREREIAIRDGRFD